MASQAFEKIKQVGTLPSPTGVARDILRLADDDSTTIQEIAAVVQRDPATASRLLRLVNSPLAGVSRGIASIPQAVTLLGLDTVKSTAVSLSLIAQFKQGPCKIFDYEAFWSGSVGTAVAARHVAHVSQRALPQEVFTCGLLCQIGRLALATVYPRQYAVVLSKTDPDASFPSAEIEHELFGIDANQLAAEMMADWGLPSIYCDAVCLRDIIHEVELQDSDRLEAIARTLRFSVQVANIMLKPSPGPDSVRSLVRDASPLGLSMQVLGEVFDAVSEEWQSMGLILDVITGEVPRFAEMSSVESGA